MNDSKCSCQRVFNIYNYNIKFNKHLKMDVFICSKVIHSGGKVIYSSGIKPVVGWLDWYRSFKTPATGAEIMADNSIQIHASQMEKSWGSHYGML